ncbi:MAG TPA: ribulose-phosphate 3-epimerase [Anaerolineales bacterium]|jgi:ribulose-phosphate 3-epimerase|nr:ribulose-phosphate 3-epimerase [Anaerolineales bacterium]
MAAQPLIAPSILSADFGHLGEQIAAAELAGADWIHIDVMDGHFAPPITMGQVIVEACRHITELPLDVHLMVENPDGMLQSFAQAGADHIHVHLEASLDIGKSLQRIRKLGCKAGLAINPETPAAKVLPHLKLADMVLVMSVHPGYAGQDFIPEVLPKAAEFRRAIDSAGLDTRIEFDGGVDAETLPAALEAGGQVFVAASAVFKYPQGIAAGLQALRAASLTSLRR